LALAVDAFSGKRGRGVVQELVTALALGRRLRAATVARCTRGRKRCGGEREDTYMPHGHCLYQTSGQSEVQTIGEPLQCSPRGQSASALHAKRHMPPASTLFASHLPLMGGTAGGPFAVPLPPPP